MHTQHNTLQGQHQGKQLGLATVGTLLALHKGEKAQITNVCAKGALGRRLRDMGLLPGVELTLTGRAPLGCPVSVALDGYELSLRCEEAAQVLVLPVNDRGTSHA